MGLDTTHGCWSGSYSAFNRWRTELARAVGIELKSMYGFARALDFCSACKQQLPTGISWDALKPDAIHILLNHSDCDGSIRWQDCEAIAARLEEVAPRLANEWQEDTARFVAGLREAASLREDVEFH